MACGIPLIVVIVHGTFVVAAPTVVSRRFTVPSSR